MKRSYVLIIAGAAVLLGAVIAGSILLNNLATGTLTVATNDANSTVSVSQTNQPARKIGKGQASVRLKPGEYQVSAKSGDNESITAATVVKQGSVTVSLQLRPVLTPQAVTGYTARDIFASPASLVFVNAPFKQLYSYKLGDTKSLPYLPDVYPVASARWFNDHQAYLEGSNGNWSFLDNNAAVPLRLSGGSGAVTTPAAIAFNDSKQIAYTVEDRLYFAAGPNAAPRLLAQLPAKSWKVALSNNGTVLAFDVSESADQAVAHQSSRLVSPSGNVSTVTQLVDIVGATWSPDSAKLAYTKSDGIYVYTLRSQASTKISNTDNQTLGSTIWINANDIVFAQKNAVWRYIAGSGSAFKLAQATGSLSPSGAFSLSSDGAFLYFGTSPNVSGGGGFIYRFSIK